jgi:restriction endonuclease S subunit
VNIGGEGLPPGWSLVSLGELADIVSGITKGQKRGKETELRPVQYLRVANVQRGYLDLGEIRTIEAPEEEIQKLMLRPGDILFTEGGDRDKLGRGWIWNGELSECIHQNHIFRARLLADEIQPTYLSLYANQEGQQHFLSSGKQTTNLASISMTKLRDLPIKLPPANEQRRIVAKIEALQERSRKARAALKVTSPQTGARSIPMLNRHLSSSTASVPNAAAAGKKPNSPKCRPKAKCRRMRSGRRSIRSRRSLMKRICLNCLRDGVGHVQNKFVV